MAKKRVAITLRKPSRAPEASAASEVTPPASVPGSVAPAAAGADSKPVTVATAAIEPALIEAFVSGAATIGEPTPPGAPALSPARVADAVTAAPTASSAPLTAGAITAPAPSRVPEGYREITVLLPEGLARELSVYCLQHNLDVSRVVLNALERLLEHVELEAKAPGMSATARTALRDLGRWLRTFWSMRRRPFSAAGGPLGDMSAAAH